MTASRPHRARYHQASRLENWFRLRLVSRDHRTWPGRVVFNFVQWRFIVLRRPAGIQYELQNRLVGA